MPVSTTYLRGMFWETGDSEVWAPTLEVPIEVATDKPAALVLMDEQSQLIIMTEVQLVVAASASFVSACLFLSRFI